MLKLTGNPQPDQWWVEEFTGYVAGSCGGKIDYILRVDTDCLDAIFLDRLDELEQKLSTPKKISKPKHAPPFWANNWRKK